MLSSIEAMAADPAAVAIASHLTPAVVRVGGITADWLRYSLNGSSSAVDASWSHKVGGFWPAAPQNITLAQFYELTHFMRAANLSLLFDLNELYGRNCSAVGPHGGDPVWCVGDWDTSNVRAFLQRLHDDGAVGGPSNSLFGFELGNELVTHLDPTVNTQDILTLAGILADVWSDEPSAVPPLYAPSTDDCRDDEGQSAAIMANVSGHVAGFTYHAYPGGGGNPPNTLESLLTNVTWLRTGILTGSSSNQCIADWNSLPGPAESRMALWITEASSSWNWQLPSPAQNSFLHGFFSLAQYGTYAPTGVGIVSRWSFSEQSPFGTVIRNGSRWDVASDYWLIVAYKRLVGTSILQVVGDDVPGSTALVYAACSLDAQSAHGSDQWDLAARRHPLAGTHPTTPNLRVSNSNGSITILAVNPVPTPTTLSIVTAGSGAAIATTPRVEYVFTPPGGVDLGSFNPVLNGNEQAPLRINTDGSLPPMPGRFVDASGASELTLPPYSWSFFVLTNAQAAGCQA